MFDNISPKPTLTQKIEIILRQDRHQIILVHRDQDNTTRTHRMSEIQSALETAQRAIAPEQRINYVPVIPVRMTEAWLLIDEAAIKQAAGYPNNRTPLNLPRPRQLETFADPKSLLYEKIRTASGHTGRKLKNVRPQQIIHTLADIIEDYSSLDDLPAFQRLRQDLTEAIDKLRPEAK